MAAEHAPGVLGIVHCRREVVTPSLFSMSFPLLTADEQTDLVARIERGEADAEARLVQLFSGAVRTMTRARTRGALDDQDVCQEVMLAAITAVRRGRLREAERLGAFVAGVARNIINNQLRFQSRRPLEPLTSDDVSTADFRDEIAQRERTGMVRAALQDMSAEDRQILLLTLVEGLKSGEAARRLGLDAEVTRARKSRAIKRLIERLRGTGRPSGTR
jgi:RNA polymerase sigma factor (sigma-70 family)